MGNASNLSDDDILCILRLLPFSSLVRAGAVCNRWRRLARVAVTKQHSSWCILSCPARRPAPSELEKKQLGLSHSGSSRIRQRLRSVSSRDDGLGLSRSGSSRDRLVGLSRSKCSRIAAFPQDTDNYHVVMFDPFTRKWLKVANPFGRNCGGPFGSPTKELLWLPSTGGYSGLVCVVEWEEESCRRYNVYWVGNPITNKWKCIVGPSPWRGVHQLVVNPTTKTYKIVSLRWERVRPANVRSGVWRVAIYDSAEEKWRPGATFTVPQPPPASHPKAYTLSSRTHTASDKMMYLLMYRAGKLENWETYTEIRIVGYEIESDEFKYITPFCQFDHCLKYFEPTNCRNWPVHLVLTADQLTNTNHVPSAQAERTPHPAPPVCPQLVTSSTSLVRSRCIFSEIFQKIKNVILCRRGYHKEFTNKLCIMEFNPVTESWDVKEESSSQVTGKFYTKHRVFHCAGDRLEHLYCAHVNCHQSVVVWNAERDNFSNWSRLPPLGKEYGGFIAKNYHFLGSFVPRLDAEP